MRGVSSKTELPCASFFASTKGSVLKIPRPQPDILHPINSVIKMTNAEEKKIARAVIEGLILKHAAQRFAGAEESR